LANGQWDAIHRKIYTDSHAGSRRISSILKKIDNQSGGPQPTFANPLPSINKHKLTSIIDNMEPSSGGRDKAIAALQNRHLTDHWVAAQW
jgi:hypothetical protein